MRRVDAEIFDAANLYERFTGRKSRVSGSAYLRLPEPSALAIVGKLDFVGYTANRDRRGEKYIHEFAPRARPWLCSSADGSQLWIVGGRYRFTERGIVDF